jgi:hypothetical protein
MDAKRRKDGRQRCRECGRKYEPEARSRKHQQTCAEPCRLKRRARQARARYQAALLAARGAARERQRKARRGRKPRPAPPGEPLSTDVLRAIAQEMNGLLPEGWLARSDVEQALRRVARRASASALSRAGLEAKSPANPG